MADCHVPLPIPEANAGRISAPVPPPPLVTKVANGEKENKEHNLCTDPYPASFTKNREEGEGAWTQATMRRDLKKPKHKCFNV